MSLSSCGHDDELKMRELFSHTNCRVALAVSPTNYSEHTSGNASKLVVTPWHFSSHHTVYKHSSRFTSYLFHAFFLEESEKIECWSFHTVNTSCCICACTVRVWMSRLCLAMCMHTRDRCVLQSFACSNISWFVKSADSCGTILVVCKQINEY